MRTFAKLASIMLLAGCQGAGEPERSESFSAIAPEETVRFTGTEPFWHGRIDGGQALYATPDNQDGIRFPVRRFSGLNGAGFSGDMQGTSFDLTVTPGTCSDGMSDRSYPYTATLRIADETREGCAWTDRQPFAEQAVQ